MRKVFSLLLTVTLFTQAFAQAPVEQEGENTQIMASLDSLTEVLHAAGFLKNAEYAELAKANPDLSKVHVEYDGVKIQERMNALGSEIPLEFNYYVKNFIDLYGRRKKSLTSRMMGLSDYYFPTFEEILDKNNLPLEFKYLSIVESALNPKATSWAGASGAWQFIHSTGVLYGLTINSYIDERRDLYKSTQAACDYFKNSYELYGDWLLVIASYNCGPGNVNKAIRRSGGKKTFWEIRPWLPKETRGYVPAFIAVTYLMNYAAEHGIEPTAVDMHKLVQKVEIKDLVSFEQLASTLKMSEDAIHDLNPHLPERMIPDMDVPTAVYLPYDKAMKLASIRDSVQLMPMYDEEGKPYRLEITMDKVRYKVRRGDNIYSIARKYNVTSSDIKKWNVVRRNRVYPGRYLTIHIEHKEMVYLETKPPKEENKALAGKSIPTPVATCAIYHQVKSGDTLFSIAKEYGGIDIEKLKNLNGMEGDEILVPGRILKVKEGS